MVGAVLLVAAALGVAAHFLGAVSATATLIAPFSPLLTAGGAVALLLLVAGGQRLLAIVAIVVVAVGIWAQSPLYRADAAVTPTAATVRLMQANIYLGRADPNVVVARVRDEDIDLLTAVELTPESERGLSAAGLGAELPYSYAQPREGGSGAGIFSRYPLSSGALLPGLQHNNLRAVVTMPAAPAFAVYALHPLAPYPEPSWRWATELGRLAALLDDETLPLIIGADFNSTFDHKRFRDLLAGSGGADSPQLVDAAQYLGAGIVATYPANRVYPAVLAIDRILTRGATPTDFRRVELPGSDHHGVIGDIQLTP